MNKEILIIGAGKIGRGFIAHLFYKSGYKLWFLDASQEVVQLLNIEKKYRVDIAREQMDLTEYIEVEGAYTTCYNVCMRNNLCDFFLIV